MHSNTDPLAIKKKSFLSLECRRPFPSTILSEINIAALLNGSTKAIDLLENQMKASGALVGTVDGLHFIDWTTVFKFEHGKST
jgi:hypothetical protein